MDKNDPPPAHLAAGIAAAGDVPATGGGFTALGMSTTSQIYFTWRGTVADTVCELMQPVLAQSGRTLDNWDAATKSGWTSRWPTVLGTGYEPEDFHVVWVLLVRGTAENITPLTLSGLEGVLTQIRDHMPNCKQVFFSTYPYGGYDDNEPVFWEDGRTVREFILGHLGETAPWVGWGPYLWANGENPRSDGLTWDPTDYEADGVHLTTAGQTKAANLLEDFFQTSPLTPWYRSA